MEEMSRQISKLKGAETLRHAQMKILLTTAHDDDKARC